VAFDIIETCFDLTPLGQRLQDIGLPDSILSLWFNRSLRDLFALAATDTYRPFRDILDANLGALSSIHGRTLGDEDRQHVLSGFAVLPPHPDTAAAFRRLHECGVRIVALSNGAAAATEKLLEHAGIRPLVEHVVSIDMIGLPKPCKEVYLRAADLCGEKPERLALVAAHPWDLHGAARAGFITAYVARQERFPDIFKAPDVEADTLEIVVERILALPEG
jgi:2-haloacid dehalogenase